MNVETDEVRVGFTGHQRLTPSTELAVRVALESRLRSKAGLTGICSLAEGSDQIFAEQVLAAGGSLTVVLPCEDYETTFETEGALANYRKLLTSAERVIKLEFREPTEEAFWAAGQCVVELSDVMIAVWNGEKSGGLGGTADVVAFARERGKDVDVLWPAGAERQS